MAYNEDLFGDGHSFEQVMTPAGMHFIANDWERYVPVWYPDGTWRSGPRKGEPKFSIGYGHGENDLIWPFSVKDKPDLFLTEPQAGAVFLQDLAPRLEWVRSKLKVKANTFMINALVSLVFNYGEGNVLEVGTVFPELNAERYVAAAVGFIDCNKITVDGALVKKNGLTLRRACEAALFRTKVMKGQSHGLVQQ